jgi:hypothetical protein
MPSKAGLSGRDYNGEITRLSYYLAAVAAGGANYDAVVLSQEAVQAAVQGVSLIDFEGEFIKVLDTPTESDNAASDRAQRELKWLVTYRDPTNVIGNGSFEIGGADTGLLEANKDTMDLTAGAGLTLKTDLEANLVSRLGNAIEVLEVRLVGRSI